MLVHTMLFGIFTILAHITITMQPFSHVLVFYMIDIRLGLLNIMEFKNMTCKMFDVYMLGERLAPYVTYCLYESGCPTILHVTLQVRVTWILLPITPEFHGD